MRDNEYKNEYDGEFDNLQTAGGGSLRWISMLVMGMVIFGFFSLVFYAYNSSVEVANNDLIPTITAGGDDYKVKPEDAGGMPIENTDIEAYQLMRGAGNTPAEEANQVEKLLPLSERPIVRDMNGSPEVLQGELQKMQNTENNVDEVVTAEQNNQSAQALLPQEQKIPQAVSNDVVLNNAPEEAVQQDNIDMAINEVLQKQAAQAQSPTTLSDIAQNKVVDNVNSETVPLKPIVKTIIAKPNVAEPTVVNKAPVVEKQVVKTMVASPQPIIKKDPPQQIAKLAPAPASVVQAPITKVPAVVLPPKAIMQAPASSSTPVVSSTPATKAVASSTYIQFAAMRSSADAPKVWAELKAKHPELNPYGYYTETVTLPTGSTLYRLRVKGFASRNQALSVCSAVKARGQDCLVSAN
jgi:SPOR domain